VYAFIESFAPTLTLAAVEQAMAIEPGTSFEI
jgi:hypothetical protein